MAALDLMASNPFAGDIARLKGEDAAWRRRVGSYRLFFEIHEDARLVDIVDIRRRTSATY